MWNWVYLSRVASTGAITVRLNGNTYTGTGDIGSKTTSFTRIGSIEATPTGTTLFLDGSLADIRIYSKLLSVNEQDAIYYGNGHDRIRDSLWLHYAWYTSAGAALSGTLYDLSENGRTGTITPSATGVEVPLSFRNRRE